MQIRLDSLYRDIDETEKELSAIYERLENIRKDKISQKKVYQFLLYFDIIYPKFSNAERREFLGSFIERIEINPEPTENGQILKKIKFRIPIYFDGNDGSNVEVSFPNEKITVECVALLNRG
jgi:site-specific DNA recombinase